MAKTNIIEAEENWNNDTRPDEREQVLKELDLKIDYKKLIEYSSYNYDFNDLPKYIQKRLYRYWIINKLYDREKYDADIIL